MKRILLMLTVIALMASCGKGDSSKPESEIEEEEVTIIDENGEETTIKKIKGDPNTDEYLLARVQAIYDDVFAEYNRASENEELTIPSTPDDKYCTKEWNSLLQKVNDYDSTHNPDEIGFFDADYWVMGQDFAELSISDLNVVKRKGNDAEVEFILHNHSARTKVKLEMVLERGDWYIDNFIDSTYDIDWKEGMEEYLDQ